MRRFILSSSLAVVAALVLAPCPAHARRLPPWPYDRLVREADVVVIAYALSVEDSGETTTDNPWKEEFEGVNTTFEARAVLKGKLDAEKLRVLHYRLQPGVLIENGPCLVSFRLRGRRLATEGKAVELGKPAYLLFLKRRKDGRYEPVSGQVDPALSVREMYQPPAD